ncbi:MFS transporter [Streptomyces sp. NBC_01808]|uniref:MFS transporter n=1 Tax=Streptomyces sp. NBC_01808 TaxID=2975947 RepID=UPI002DD9CE75|nr:MFS transporter [Streptomyces sp. NBC_01808]WSA38373.1 MFS transporter [Streptomyces sp. NBC_01808]
MTERWARTFAGLIAALLCTFTAVGMVIPIIPKLVTDELDGSAFEVGVTFTVSGVVALLVRPYAGQLAQRTGCRRVMLFGAVLIVATAGLYALPFGLPGLYAARVLLGVGEAMLFMAGSLWTVALAPQDRRAQIVGFYGLAMWSGFALGPVLGELVHRAGSFGAVWATVAALPAVAFCVIFALTDRVERGAAVSRKLLPRSAVLPGVSLACGSFGYAMVAGFGALAMTHRGVAHGSVVVSAFGVAYVTVRVVAGRIPDRVGALPVVVFSASVEALGMVLIAFASDLWLAALGALIAGGGFTLLYPALALLTIDAAPESERGAALGAVTSFFDVAIGLAGLIGGALAGVSYTLTFLIAAGAVLGSLYAGTAAARAAAAPDPAAA